ncbi:MAG: DNA/RNA non-specific endonuclease [Flavobacteriaceae bacterium]
MSRKTIYPLLIVLIVSGLYYFENHYDFDKTKTEEVYQEVDQKDSNFDDSFLPHSTTGELVHHQFYSLSYSSKHKQAEWVAYTLHPRHLSDNSFKRPYFEIDKKIKGGSADWRNYRGSGSDRGHLCPAGDRRFSYEAYAETFLTSNASPQDSKFNAGVWNRLEIQIRQWVPKTGELYIITGGVLKDGLKTIGKDKVSIPDYFFKVVMGYDETTPKAIAFLIPNKPSGESLSTFVTPISHIENLTGLSFFKNGNQETEAQLKGPVDFDFWKLR